MEKSKFLLYFGGIISAIMCKNYYSLRTFGHLSAYLHFFSSDVWVIGVVLGVILSDEFISMVKKLFKCKKCARTQALLGIYKIYVKFIALVYRLLKRLLTLLKLVKQCNL